MITYESLKELARVLLKLTGYRYVAFSESNTAGLVITFSDSEMKWISSESLPYEFWSGGMHVLTLGLRGFSNLDWSQCQFDCKEADNEEEN